MYGGGGGKGRRFFWGVAEAGRGEASTKECLAVFGDDIGIGGRHLETADWKIMGNGGI